MTDSDARGQSILLRVRLFGFPSAVWHHGTPLELESNKVRSLFVYLLLHAGQVFSRDELASLLWPDVEAERARKNLRQVLYNLRQALGPLAEGCLALHRDTVTLQEHPALWVDVWDFRHLAHTVARHRHRARGICPYCARHYEGMVDLYRGEFLQGIAVRSEASPMEEWIEAQRRHYRHVIQQGVHVLFRYYHLRGDYGQLEKLAQWWLQHEPWDDAGYAYLMRALAHQERGGEAYRVYHRYVRRMKELELPVPEEARHLLYEIQQGLLPEPKSVLWGRRLPLPETAFIGRREEYQEVLTRLADPGTRLLTIIGPGGSGKTRLALEVARGMLSLFPDGVFWVPVGSAATEHDLRLALQEALEHELPPDTWMRAWAAWARERQALVVLDQVEALTEVLARRLPSLLAQAPHLVLLVTSRQALAIPHEERFPLWGLRYPAPELGPLDLDEALHYPAVALFLERARKLAPSFLPEGDELQALVAILHLTRGLPLAVELAAAQAALTSCREVLERLQNSCLDLATVYRDQPVHHRSLRGLVLTAWEGLPRRLQEALLRLSVFQGAFDAHLAREVADVSQQDLQALTLASLLEQQEHATLQHVWLLHSFIQEFARHRLKERPDLHRTLHERVHAWVQRALEGLPTVPNPRQFLTLHRLASLRPYVERVIQGLFEGASTEVIASLVPTISVWFSHHGQLDAGRALLTQLEQRLTGDGLPQDPATRRALARVLHRRGLLAFRQGDVEQAERDALRALHLLEQEDPEGIDRARALQLLSGVREVHGQLDEAAALEEQALAIFTRHQADLDRANALNNLGSIAFHRGDMEEAARYYQQALEGYRAGEGWTFMANTLCNLSVIELTRDHYQQALRLGEEALRVAQKARAQLPLCYAWSNLGIIAMHIGDYVMAYRRLHQAEQLARRIGKYDLLVDVLTNLGFTLSHLGKLPEARTRFEEALTLARERQLTYALALTCSLYAQALMEHNRFEEALPLIHQGLRLAVEHDYTYVQWNLLRLLGHCLYTQGLNDAGHALLYWLEQQDLPREVQVYLQETKRRVHFPKRPSRTLKALAERYSSAKSWLTFLEGHLAPNGPERVAGLAQA